MDCVVKSSRDMVEHILIVVWIIIELHEVVKKSLCNARLVIGMWYDVSHRPANRYPHEWMGSWDEGALTTVQVYLRLTEQVSQIGLLTCSILRQEKIPRGLAQSIRDIATISAGHALAHEGIDHDGKIPRRQYLQI